MVELLTKDQSRKYLEKSHHCPVGLQYRRLVGLKATSKNFTLDCGVAEARIGHLRYTNEKFCLSLIARYWCFSLPSNIFNVGQSARYLHSVAASSRTQLSLALLSAVHFHLSLCWRCVMNRFNVFILR